MQLFAFGTTLRCVDYMKISNILMHFYFVFGTTWQCQIVSKFQVNRTNSVANRTSQSCEFCVHHILRTAVASLEIFCIPF
ncbi:hypothetical protein O3M35_000623 [Rhynocoris fuscipes]|uniref:Secreted protein n=1 Tax=Rhynocoris fuscipes TaxID=488301 RepID=A0AAW1DSA0_9HEMI